MLVMSSMFMLIGWLIGGFFIGNWVLGALLFLALASAMNFIAYFWAHKIVLWSYRAKIVTEQEAPKLHRIVRRAAELSGLPMPKVAIVKSQTPNAFATGRNPNNAVVAATDGILTLLDERELAHEMAHIKDRDILVMSIAATLAGAIAFMARMFWYNLMWAPRGRDRQSGSADLLLAVVVGITAPLAAMLLQFAISPSREYKADAVGGRNLCAPGADADADVPGRPWIGIRPAGELRDAAPRPREEPINTAGLHSGPCTRTRAEVDVMARLYTRSG